ncbi:MAG: cupin domain-containing protein [Gammaproteobacteria bacterium]|nr:cupin domain-containing protein [Gammaproteobacteria bacterium]
MNFDNFHCLGEISTTHFLEQYWQKKPLLIRNAFPNLPTLLTAEELAGLACEEHVNARLVLEKAGNKPWQLEFGPFDESRFSQLPTTNWSLLVSDVEKHCPETKALLKAFRFIPDWRIDDLMISYAPPGGSVGAHVDAYDVFLIQLCGQRLWQISEKFSDETLEDVDLHILKNFSPEHEWLLNAGDMLYLPPNVAHHGIAQAYKNNSDQNENCMTASVGSRAPSLKTMTSDYVHYLSEKLTTRYQDKKPLIPTHHAEISDDTVSHFINELKKGLTLEPDQVKRWLGQYCSDNKAFEDLANDTANSQHDIKLKELIDIIQKETLKQSPYSQFLFSNTDTDALLFVDGESHEVSREFAKTICDETIINVKQLQNVMTNADRNIFLYLYNNGSIISA